MDSTKIILELKYFNAKEFESVTELLNSLHASGLPKGFENKGLTIKFYENLNKACLTNFKNEIVMINPKKNIPESFYQTPEGCVKGFLDDLFSDEIYDDLCVNELKFRVDDEYRSKCLWQTIECMYFNEEGIVGARNNIRQACGSDQTKIDEVASFAREKASALYEYITQVEGCGDDSFIDLCWQIVANGEEFYNNINLEKIQKMIDNKEYKESFEYAFPKGDF